MIWYLDLPQSSIISWYRSSPSTPNPSPTSSHPSSSSSHQDSNSCYYYNMTYIMDLPSIGYMNIHARRILLFVFCVVLVSFVVFLLLLSTMYSCCRRPRIVRNNAQRLLMMIASASDVLNSQTTDVAVYSAQGMMNIYLPTHPTDRIPVLHFVLPILVVLSALSSNTPLYVNEEKQAQ